MPTEFHANIDANALANTLFTSLTTGSGVTLPVVDLTSTAYAAPSSTENSLYAVVPELTEASLTSREVNGTGMFDGLMASLGKHLQFEYEKGRISGKEYAEAWIASSQGALSSAVQYVLSKDQTQYQTKLVQLQARIAEIAAVSEKVNLEISKTKLAAARLETDTMQANLALAKLKIATEDAQYHALKSQTATTDYQLENLLPKELEKSQASIDAIVAETAGTAAKTAQIVYETVEMMPSQKAGLLVDNSTKSYQLTNLLPKELEKAQKSIDAAVADIAATVAKKDQVLYETSDILPTQKLGIVGENAIKTYQLANLLPKDLEKAQKAIEAATAEIAGTTAKTTQIIYETTQMMPVQRDGLLTENSTKSYQLTTLLPLEVTKTNKQLESMTAEIVGIQADSDIKVFQLEEILPKDVLKTQKEIDAITSDIAATTAKTTQITYETTNILPAQKTGLVAESSIKEFQLANIMPKELLKITADIAAVNADVASSEAKTDQIVYETTEILPQQKLSLVADVSTKTYQLTNLLPKDLEKAQKAIEAASAEISATVAKKDQILYETASILPTQKTGIEGDNAIKVYQLASVLTAQTANMTADTAGKVYSNQFLLPAQLETIREQTEANRAKTKDTRTDGSAIAGAIGKQNSLQQQQIDSYKRDSEAKVAKMLLDTWVTQKSLDEGLPAPASLTDTNINTVMTKVRANLGLS